jgi:hypothetical protein
MVRRLAGPPRPVAETTDSDNCGDPLGTSAPWSVFEKPGDAIRFKSFPPQQDRWHRSGQLPRHDAIRQPFGGAKDNVDAQNNATWRTALTTECYQLFSLRIAEGESDRRGKWHSHILYAVIPGISKAISDTGD